MRDMERSSLLQSVVPRACKLQMEARGAVSSAVKVMILWKPAFTIRNINSSCDFEWNEWS